ncbi:hypothetical protein QCA50_005212 [Cerrena zonata]|uniref:AB hydrolase-1 domain-containing protein n=1 Tax=Cerrena zonata TaxID=2478898 RepID=A0AAW0FCJ7_9APHY
MLPISGYKDTTTKRGFKYHYYYAPAQGSKQTLLFCHGFPSTSQDWHRLVPHFEQQGYGIIVPDTLGYGGTDKPLDPVAYRGTLLAKDLIDIVDAEKLDKIIAIGHDWGSFIISRLASVAPNRIFAYAFLAVSYIAPNPDFHFEAALKATKEAFGYELIGYQAFFADDSTAAILENNWDTVFGILWPQDAAIWKTHLAPLGALKAAIEEGKKRPLPSYLSEEDKKAITKPLLDGGFAAPTCYYKVQVRGLSLEDELTIPKERYLPPTSSPIFFAASLRDYIGLAAMQKGNLTSPKFKDHNVTIHEYDADHWILLSHAEEVGKDLDAWLAKIVPAS